MNHDPDVFYRLIWPHAPSLLRTAQMLCRNEADAEDIVQEALLKAYRHLDQFEPGSNIQSWLMRILRNTRIDRLRADAVRRSESLDAIGFDLAAEEPKDAADPELWADPTALLESLSDQKLISMMLRLPEEIRWSLLLVDVEGLELSEAAGVMEIPTGTVKSRLHRGRRMLREQIESLHSSGTTGER